MFNQRAQVVGVHAILIAYSALAVGPILLVVMNSFKIAQRHLRRAARAADCSDLLADRLRQGL